MTKKKEPVAGIQVFNCNFNAEAGDIICLLVQKDCNLDEWLDGIEEKSKELGIEVDEENCTLIALTCPCGATLDIKRKEDFPRENRMCKAGHYFIKFEGIEDEES